MRILLLFPATLFMTGCIGGWDFSGPQPEGPWKGPATALSLPAARPIRDDGGGEYQWSVGITSAPPERIITRARCLLEPAYGPLKYVRRDIPNGRTGHTLLTPRFDVSNRGHDYHWLQVSINFNPDDGLSMVEVERIDRSKRWVLTSFHGGVWLFPPPM